MNLRNLFLPLILLLKNTAYGEGATAGVFGLSVKRTSFILGVTLCYANIRIFRDANRSLFPVYREPYASSWSSNLSNQRRKIFFTESAVSYPSRIDHEIDRERPVDWSQLSSYVRDSSPTVGLRAHGRPFSSRDIDTEKSNPTLPAKNATSAWKPPPKRPVFTEWESRDAHRIAILQRAVDTESLGRPARFPSIDQRVRLYMSNWYHPPCSSLSALRFERRPNATWRVQEQPSAQQTARNRTRNDRFLDVNSTIMRDVVLSTDKTSIGACIAKYSEAEVLRSYCDDVADTFAALPSGSITSGSTDSTMSFPFLWQLGDAKVSMNYGSLNVPHIRKIRSVALDFSFINDSSTCHKSPRQALTTLNQNGHLQPVLWMLNSARHYGKLSIVSKKDGATPWARKIPQAVFRGALSGHFRDGYSHELDALSNCQRSRRCRLVFEHDQSTLVNARLTKTLGFLPETVGGVPLLDTRKRTLNIEDQLKYKAIIMLEGNDVASGLKWALLSSSVVLMAIPTYTSWAMEEWLEPWVHFVPLKDDLSNVEEQMQWIIDHDAEAQAIALRATLWMKDLLLHEDAAADTAEIRRRILQRYSQQWSAKLSTD